MGVQEFVRVCRRESNLLLVAHFVNMWTQPDVSLNFAAPVKELQDWNQAQKFCHHCNGRKGLNMRCIFDAVGKWRLAQPPWSRGVVNSAWPWSVILLSTLLISGSQAMDGHQQLTSRRVTAATDIVSKSKRKGVRRTRPINSSKPLPYSTEVNLGNSQTQVALTLVVGTITVVHCPEPLRRVILDDRYQTSISLFIGGPGRSDIYIRPLKGGVIANLIIEMPSAETTFGLKTIRVKGGAKVGDYHGEVTIRLPGYREETVKLKSKVSELEKQFREVSERVREKDERAKQLEAVAIERERIARDQAGRQAFADNLAVVEKLSDQPLKKRRTVSQKKVRVAQVGRSVRDKSGRWWSIFMFENRGKTPVTIEEMGASNGGMVSVTTSGRQIKARGKVQLAVVIDSNPSLTVPPNLTVVINGLNFNITLE